MAAESRRRALPGKASSLGFLDGLKHKTTCLEPETWRTAKALSSSWETEPDRLARRRLGRIKHVVRNPGGIRRFNLAGFRDGQPADGKNQPVAQNFKFFTEQLDKHVNSDAVAERYARDGQLRLETTSLDESPWLRIIRLMD